MNTMAWQGFQTGKWTKEIDVRNFIQKNYTLYEGDDTFLEGVTDRTQKVWDKCHELILEEMKKAFWMWKPISYPVLTILHRDILTRKMR